MESNLTPKSFSQLPFFILNLFIFMLASRLVLKTKWHLSALPFKKLFSNHLNRHTETRSRNSKLNLLVSNLVSQRGKQDDCIKTTKIVKIYLYTTTWPLTQNTKFYRSIFIRSRSFSSLAYLKLCNHNIFHTPPPSRKNLIPLQIFV